jgi:hypothetical protein
VAKPTLRDWRKPVPEASAILFWLLPLSLTRNTPKFKGGIYQIQSHPLNNPEQIEAVRSRLDENGFHDWLEQG